MIYFKVGLYEKNFDGKIEYQVKENWLFEKKDPFVPGGFFRHGRYYKDVLSLSVIITPAEYKTLFEKTAEADKWLIAWFNKSGNAGFQWREIKGKLPYPDKIRYLSDSVNMSIETEPYFSINHEMESILTKNMVWNVSTISNTVWN